MRRTIMPTYYIGLGTFGLDTLSDLYARFCDFNPESLKACRFSLILPQALSCEGKPIYTAEYVNRLEYGAPTYCTIEEFIEKRNNLAQKLLSDVSSDIEVHYKCLDYLSTLTDAEKGADDSINYVMPPLIVVVGKASELLTSALGILTPLLFRSTYFPHPEKKIIAMFDVHPEKEPEKNATTCQFLHDLYQIYTGSADPETINFICNGKTIAEASVRKPFDKIYLMDRYLPGAKVIPADVIPNYCGGYLFNLFFLPLYSGNQDLAQKFYSFSPRGTADVPVFSSFALYSLIIPHNHLKKYCTYRTAQDVLKTYPLKVEQFAETIEDLSTLLGKNAIENREKEIENSGIFHFLEAKSKISHWTSEHQDLYLTLNHEMFRVSDVDGWNDLFTIEKFKDITLEDWSRHIQYIDTFGKERIQRDFKRKIEKQAEERLRRFSSSLLKFRDELLALKKNGHYYVYYAARALYWDFYKKLQEIQGHQINTRDRFESIGFSKAKIELNQQIEKFPRPVAIWARIFLFFALILTGLSQIGEVLAWTIFPTQIEIGGGLLLSFLILSTWLYFSKKSNLFHALRQILGALEQDLRDYENQIKKEVLVTYYEKILEVLSIFVSPDEKKEKCKPSEKILAYEKMYVEMLLLVNQKLEKIEYTAKTAERTILSKDLFEVIYLCHEQNPAETEKIKQEKVTERTILWADLIHGKLFEKSIIGWKDDSIYDIPSLTNSFIHQFIPYWNFLDRRDINYYINNFNINISELGFVVSDGLIPLIRLSDQGGGPYKVMLTPSSSPLPEKIEKSQNFKEFRRIPMNSEFMITLIDLFSDISWESIITIKNDLCNYFETCMKNISSKVKNAMSFFNLLKGK